MDDPYCVANRRLRAENCLLTAVECKLEINLIPPLALQTIPMNKKAASAF